MKLTNEEIAKVFAMYCPCKILGHKSVLTYGGINDAVANGDQMELTPLSKISNEDAIEVGKIMYGSEFTEGRVDKSGANVAVTILKPNTTINHCYFITDSGFISTANGWQCYKVLFSYQYLISQSYAVPLFFAPGHWANAKTAIELGIAIEK